MRQRIGEGGYRHVLGIALPLIMSHASATIMMFADRLFLSWYNGDALSGAAMSGMMGWTMMSLFIGTAAYTGTFVAQYWGAGKRERIPVVVWQGIYFAVFACCVMAVVSAFAGPIVAMTGHDADVSREEVIYFRIFVLGGGLPVLGAVMGSFFNGIGKTYYTMAIQGAGHGLNIFLNWVLIFGHLGMPRWGTKGAAVATVVSWGFIVFLYVVVIRVGRLGREYGILRGPLIDRALLGRLLRYGVPNGLQWTLDMVGWTLFMMFVGRLGKAEMQAVVVVFTLNNFAFLPMIGFGIATSILVGQAIGARRVPLAEKATRSALVMTVGYMSVLGAAFLLMPERLVSLFEGRSTGVEFASVMSLARTYLVFVAFYCVVDGANIVYSGALKGAGDTRFVMWMIAVLSFFGLILPTWVLVKLDAPLWLLALATTVYIGVMAVAFYLRYRHGKWKTMSVIEGAGAADGATDGE